MLNLRLLGKQFRWIFEQEQYKPAEGYRRWHAPRYEVARTPL